jgi:hypothetical protein
LGRRLKGSRRLKGVLGVQQAVSMTDGEYID